MCTPPEFAPPRVIGPLEALAILEGRARTFASVLTDVPPDVTPQPGQSATSDHEPGHAAAPASN